LAEIKNKQKKEEHKENYVFFPNQLKTDLFSKISI